VGRPPFFSEALRKTKTLGMLALNQNGYGNMVVIIVSSP
jgi:hypothetical protein